MKANKFDYYKVIQQNYGQGWEDVSFYPTNSQFVVIDNKSGIFKTSEKTGKTFERKLIVCDFEEYCSMGYPTRIIKRKELKQCN